MAPPRFTSGALITRNNFDALDGGFPRPRPVGCPGRGSSFRDELPTPHKTPAADKDRGDFELA
jgi:hypothetical protein